MAQSLNSLGELARYQGDLDLARKLYTESLTRYRALGNTLGVAMVLHNSGHVARHEGELEQALATFVESLKLYNTLGSHEGVALSLAGLAAIFARLGSAELAARWYGAACALHHTSGAVLEPADRVEWSCLRIDLEAALESETLTAALAVGRSLNAVQAIAEAVQHTA